jgi:hypothetical protein
MQRAGPPRRSERSIERGANALGEDLHALLMLPGPIPNIEANDANRVVRMNGIEGANPVQQRLMLSVGRYEQLNRRLAQGAVTEPAIQPLGSKDGVLECQKTKSLSLDKLLDRGNFKVEIRPAAVDTLPDRHNRSASDLLIETTVQEPGPGFGTLCG